jgi:glycosyltransferase involved in cell wall biosynthesis
MDAIYRREAVRLQAFEKAATRTAAATTVVNERERAAVFSINPGADVRVISNGIDAEHFRTAQPPSDTSNVVFCGVFNYRPNEMGAVWLAKDVWPLVRRRVPRATLTLVGMDPTRAVRQLAADPSITVTGRVPDVRPYLWRSAVAAAPLAVARGIQNKVLEALAAGLPCVITPSVAAGLPASVLPACAIASTPTGFANSLSDLLNAAPPERYHRANEADLDRLTWNSQLSPMIELLRSAARSKAARPVLT